MHSDKLKTNMKRNRSTLFAVEGRPFIIPLVVLTLILAVVQCAWWVILSAAVTFFVAYFFRNPPRDIPGEDKAVISPADGRIVQKKLVSNNEYLNSDAMKVSVFMNVFNVHVNRAPFAGKVLRVEYHPGKFVNASFDKASELNERNAVTIETDDGKKILFVQIAGLIARRIVCYVNEGDCLAKGERFGLIRFGSRVDVYLPVDAQINVNIGDKVIAGETVLGYIK